jgi:CHAP domain
VAGRISQAPDCFRARASPTLLAGALCFPVSVLVAGLLLAPAGNAATTRTVSLLRATVSARPGQTAVFAFAVSGVARCTLVALGDRQTAITRGAERVTFWFTVPRTRPGRHWVTAACSGVAAKRFPLRILAPARSGANPGTPPVPASVTVPAAPPPAAPQPATPDQLAARAWWAANAGQILATFRNGQCTDLAASKRPDIVERVEEAAQIAELHGLPFPPLDFTAKNWALLAQAAGLTVGDTPVAGALVVWQPGVEGAAIMTGHVGFVVSVGAGSFQTSEENVDGPYLVSSRTLSAAPVPGRVFIYP